MRVLTLLGCPKRTLPAMAKQAGPTSIIFDMPGPERDREPAPEPTYADVRT